jgi:hypothetical protein
MGDHYIPQYYLKGFSGDGGKTVWVYDKADRRKFAARVRNIANETGFYSPEMESYLAEHVEEPAKPVLERIRRRSKISTADKQVLSAYMMCMMIRVPQGKKRIKQFAPSVADKLREDVDRHWSSALLEDPAKAAFIEERRSRDHEMIDRYAQDPPDDIWLRTIPPEKWPRALVALSSMTWVFLTFDQYPAFLASDNPVFYFTNIGIGRPESEVTFPVSSHIALWASRRTDLTEGFFETKQQVVREVNRRTASVATRYVFHSGDEDWVLRLLTQRSWRLNMLE